MHAETIHIAKNERRTEPIILMIEGSEVALHVTAEDNTAVDIICINTREEDTVIKHQSTLDAHAKIHWYNISLGSGNTHHSLISRIEGEGSESSIDWIFYGKGHEKYTLRATNIFSAPHGKGQITVHGIAEEKSHCVFDGKIEITENGNGTDTYLTETVLMLDHTAKVDAIPGLEIKTNDVKASHAATVTKVSSDDLFYFASRGIEEDEARKMYIEGFLGAAAEGIPDKKIGDAIREALQKKLSS